MTTPKTHFNHTIASQITQYTSDVYHTVKKKIEEQDNLGQRELYFSLLFNLDFPGVSLKDAQLIVWSSLVSDLAKEYKVEIDIREDSCILYIKWQSLIDEADRAKMRNILSRHRKRN